MSAVSTRGLWRRVEACFVMSGLNFSSLLLPKIEEPYHLILLISVLVANLAVCLVVLRGVGPSRDADDHARLAAFIKRWFLWLGASATSAVLILGAAERLHGRQAIPFILCGYAFLLVAPKVLQISFFKWMDALEDEA